MATTSGVEQLDALLERLLGDGATFRDGQREAIEAVLGGRRTLVVQRTGWGKSLVYWLATRVLRDRGQGPTLVISPLLALMRDQLRAADRLGLRAVTINSGNVEEWDAAEAAISSDEVDVLMISPERLSNERFGETVLPVLRRGVGLFVVDEAHCISDWGHDFRPHYRRIRRLIAALPPRIPVLATTATANDRVVADIAEQFGVGVEVIRGPLARSSLRLQAIELRDGAERMAWLAEQLPQMPGNGIVYCLTIADCERVAAWLRSQGIDAQAYHAQLLPDERVALETDLLANRVKAIVASTALGMGFDKPDLGFVIHFQRPGSVIAYYQQVGRAGRALDDAYGVLLSGREDDEILDYFIDSAFPPDFDMKAVIGALDRTAAMSIFQLEAALNLKRSRIQKALTLLEIDGAIARDGGRYRRTDTPYVPDRERMDRITELRRAEKHEMRAYLHHHGCLMEFLTRALDDPSPEPCGRCAPELGGLLPVTVDQARVLEAIRLLRGSVEVIEPRRQWPAGAVEGLKGKIALPNEEGRALSVEGDAGWGREVAAGKVAGDFSDALVSAAAELVRDRWRPQPAPRWVTAVPSAGHPTLVSDFARRLAAELGLPYRDVLAAAPAPEQRTMENSAQQLRNVAAALSRAGPPADAPVLLVDDLVDSRWTLTYAGWLLREAGVPAVHPLALAIASASEGEG
jgi:ATP-dependent DNA helicase RecQ